LFILLLILFVFDRDRALRPTLGIIDPDHTRHCGPELTAFSGLDVLCHALESYTAVPYQQRSASPLTPQHRPAYQGCNPISDIWSGYALQQCAKYLPRVVHSASKTSNSSGSSSAGEEYDSEAREQMCLAATAAGVGFGNAGVHLCHGMSYPIASLVRKYRPSTGKKKYIF
jgi:hydroxyacid-oxoacid transhydrogenase